MFKSFIAVLFAIAPVVVPMLLLIFLGLPLDLFSKLVIAGIYLLVVLAIATLTIMLQYLPLINRKL